ncbi:MAG: nitroreductase family protein [Candidatus Thorarchaeota archaeon]|jgi:nitroreductase
MDVDEAIKDRRSIMKFKPDDLVITVVHEIVEAGRNAPYAHKDEQRRFTVIANQSKQQFTDLFRQELDKLAKSFGMDYMGSAFDSLEAMIQAPILVAVWNASVHKWDTGIQSVAAAIQNMLLKAHREGLGGLWVGDIYYASEALEKYLGKPWKLAAIVCLGFPAEIPPPKPKAPLSDVLEFLG